MKFTDRFISIPVKIYNKKEAELTNGNASCEDVFAKIDPFNIEHWRPTYDDAFPNENCVFVQLKSQESFIVYMSMEDFEEMLNNFEPPTFYEKIKHQ